MFACRLSLVFFGFLSFKSLLGIFKVVMVFTAHLLPSYYFASGLCSSGLKLKLMC